MPSVRQSVNTSKSSSSSSGSSRKTLSPTVRQAARASQMNKAGAKAKRGKKGGKQAAKGKNRVIGHRMERIAPPGGRTTIDLGGYGGDEARDSADSPSSVDVHVPRYQDGSRDTQVKASTAKRKEAPVVSQLPLERARNGGGGGGGGGFAQNVSHGGEGHEYSAYNPYKTSGKVIRVDDLPTEGLMITTPRGVPLKDCVNATRREMDDAAARWTAPDQTRVGGNAAKSARQLRQQTAAARDPPANEFGSGARRLQPPGGKSTFKF